MSNEKVLIYNTANSNDAKNCNRIITINISSKEVFVYEKKLDLTSKEFDILSLLITNAGKIYSRKKLLEIIWGYNYYGDSRAVDIHIRRLRKKIEPDPANPRYIQTKWGEGYYYKV